MKKYFSITITMLVTTALAVAQVEPTAGTWRTWFIPAGKSFRLAAPGSYEKEIAQVLAMQRQLPSKQPIEYWNAGAPGYRWQDLMAGLWYTDTSYNGILANMLLSVAIYDATIAAWNTKYTYNRPRPFAANKQIQLHVPAPNSPSYPCEHSVAAGVAATIIGHFYSSMKDSVNRLAQQVMESRIAAGVAFPSDTRAGFQLGQQIALQEIEHTKDFTNKLPWDGKRPQKAGTWKGEPHQPMAHNNKTVVLTSSSQFRPAPPPDFAKDMAELQQFKPNFMTNANAYYFATQLDETLNKKIFEYNLHLNPPRAARLYAIAAIGLYDGYASCWDAKYAYWGTRPDQYDTSYHSLLPTPPFPGYPSGHAMMSGLAAELNSYFFPADKAYFEQRAKDAAESRFQGGIHFRTDNEVGLFMGKQVAAYIIQKIKNDGAD
jgi:membrane-associated phospholipid phosphatase